MMDLEHLGLATKEWELTFSKGGFKTGTKLGAPLTNFRIFDTFLVANFQAYRFWDWSRSHFLATWLKGKGALKMGSCCSPKIGQVYIRIAWKRGLMGLIWRAPLKGGLGGDLRYVGQGEGN